MWKRITDWWASWSAMARLRHLDDRLLADIGLQREVLRAQVQDLRAANDGVVCACGQPSLKPAEPSLHSRRMLDKRGGF